MWRFFYSHCAMNLSFQVPSLFPCFQRNHFTKAPQVPLCLAELGCKERLDQVPGHGRSHCPAAHTEDIHVIVLDTLSGREMVVDQRSADARHLIGANRCSHSTAADRHPPLYLAFSDSLGKRDDEIRVIIARTQAVSAEVYHLMPRR